MMLASPSLARAAVDYRWLLDRGYPQQSSLKLVGDRQQLGRDERMILFRGISSSALSRSRSALIRVEAGGRELLVDGYNQAFTVMHHLAGRPLFLASDGLLRDAGGSHGRIAQITLFERAAAALVELLARQRPAKLLLYLDSPIPGSAGHAALFRRLFGESHIEAEVSLEKSADAPLKAAPPGSLVASADGAIADALASDRGGALLYDAARWAIDLAFGPAEILDLGKITENGELRIENRR